MSTLRRAPSVIAVAGDVALVSGAPPNAVAIRFRAGIDSAAVSGSAAALRSALCRRNASLRERRDWGARRRAWGSGSPRG